MKKSEQKQVMAKLAELGGAAFREDDVVYEGDKLVIPASMNLKDAYAFIGRKMEAERQHMSFVADFRYRPWDGAFATFNAIRKFFGMITQTTTTRESLFGTREEPPYLITIPSGPGETVQVPWGSVQIPFLDDVKFELTGTHDEDYGQLFRIQATGPRSRRHQIEGVFTLVRKELEEASLYRGKAIDGGEMPNFLDLNIDPRKVVYSEEVGVQLNANIWSVLRYAEQMRSLGLPLKRSVLIEGPYGSGKSLGAMLTAQIAVECGQTFIYGRPAKDNLETVMQTARLYQPAVVFFEDMDSVAHAGRGTDGVTRLLDAFDGITAKGTEIMVVLTTNHPERIHKGMVRPGRLDAVIHIGALDPEGMERLVRASVPESMLDEDLAFGSIADAMKGFMPAFVKEAADRAVRYAISRAEGAIAQVRLTTADFVHAAMGLRPQLELMEGAAEKVRQDAVGVAIDRVVRGAVRSNIHGNFLVPEQMAMAEVVVDGFDEEDEPENEDRF